MLKQILDRTFLPLSAHFTAYAPCTLQTAHFALAPAKEDMKGKWKANSTGPRAPGSPPALLDCSIKRPDLLQLQSCSATMHYVKIGFPKIIFPIVKRMSSNIRNRILLSPVQLNGGRKGDFR